jgi:hypothetical protein
LEKVQHNSNTPQGAADGINLVSYEIGSGGGLISTSFYYQNNNCSNDEKYFSEIDLVLRTNLTNPTQQDEENMREIIKHELGHAHMLQHAKGFGQLMHPNGNTGGVITSNDQTGANLVFAASGVCGGNPIGNGSCGVNCSTNSVGNISKDNINLSPNPTTNLLNISTNIGKIENISIINSHGQVLKEIFDTKSTFDIDVSSLPSGIYTCRIFNGKQIVNKLFLKL